MSTLWLISQDRFLLDVMQQLLPQSITIKPLATAVAAFDHLAAEPGAEVAVIVWDVVEREREELTLLKERLPQLTIPVVVVLPDVALRRAVLLAGAADYLLRPLLPYEITTRLMPYLGETSMGAESQLQTRLAALLTEREQLYAHALQAERLATVGRLTASLTHEINNPMQAIKGAMSLALEELDDPASLQDYVMLSIQQAERVIRLVQRIRQIYRPQEDMPQQVNVNSLLQDMITDVGKEMRRENVTLQTNLALAVPLVWVVPNQLQLVFLSIALHLGSALGAKDGGVLQISSHDLGRWVRVEFATAVANLPVDDQIDRLQGKTPREIGFGLSFSQAIIQAYDGEFELLERDGMLVLSLDLPSLVVAEPDAL